MNEYLRQKGLYNGLVTSDGQLYRWNLTRGLMPQSTVEVGLYPTLDLTNHPDLQTEVDRAAQLLRGDRP